MSLSGSLRKRCRSTNVNPNSAGCYLFPETRARLRLRVLLLAGKSASVCRRKSADVMVTAVLMESAKELAGLERLSVTSREHPTNFTGDLTVINSEMDESQ